MTKLHPTPRLLLPVLRLLLGVVCSSFAISTALACGATGGDNEAGKPTLKCDPNAQPATHRGTGPGSATKFSIDLITGNKYFAHTDSLWPGGLRFTRHYNSRNTFEQALGPAWRHSYETVLAFSEAANGQWRIQVIQADGRRIVFKPTGINDLYRALQPGYGTVTYQRHAAWDRRFTWRWRNGSTLSFDQDGRLTATERNNGQKLHLTYQERQLRKVTNRHGLSLQFQYDNKRLVTVILPDSRKLQFNYDPQRVLTKVRRENETLWQYSYSDEHLSAITKVIDPNGKKIATVRYNDSGRAISSTPYENEATKASDQAVQLQFKLPNSVHQTGKTIVTGGDGKTATYTWRYNPRTQQRELLTAFGDQCRACPITGITRRYDKQGRPVSTKDTRSPESTDTRRWRYDKSGRLSAMYIPSGRGRKAGFWRRYQYASERPDANLVLIESPSRAPNKQHRIELHYNALNQLVARREIGYEPNLSSLKISKNQWQISKWRKLERTWRYQYIQRGAAQGLTESVDGPLPGHMDKTVHQYDENGYRTSTISGAKPVARFAYNRYGFLASTTSAGGDTTRYGRNAQGSIVRRIDRKQRTDYQRNRREEIIGIARSDQPTIRLNKNAAGKLISIEDRAGNQLSIQQLALPATPFRQTTSTRKLIINKAGAAIKVTKPSSGETLTYLLDDFGRRVAAYDSISGIRRWVYDRADRIIVSADHHKNPLLRRYDNAGRLVGIVDNRGRRVHTTWENGRKTQSKETHQHITWKRTPNSRDVEKKITYQDPVSSHAFEKPFVLAHKHNNKGQLETKLLPDASKLTYTWRPNNTLAAIDLVLPGGDIVSLASNLNWLPFTGGQRGLISAQHGNGTNQNISLNARLKVSEFNHGPASDLPKQHIEYNTTGQIVAQTINGEKEHFNYDAKGRLRPAPVSNDSTKQIPVHWLTDANGRVRWSINPGGTSWRYVFNAAGERIGKINITDPTQSRWFIYHNRKLFAETDGNGSPVAVYLYLDNRPFVMIRYDEQARTTTTATATKVPAIYWLHTDHRGLPLAATDKHGDIVWQSRFTPYGQQRQTSKPSNGIQPISTQPHSEQQIEMPLRLPGQYHDKETGLHDNYLRTYNPRTGNYLGPDPLGLRSNGERFAYARHSPMDTTDPLGLYEIDTHYYMTYFLALAAGIDSDTAYVIAHATQGIDTFEETEPVITGEDGRTSVVEWAKTPFENQERLLRYHFTMSRRTTEIRRDYTGRVIISEGLYTDTSTDIHNPSNEQLDGLFLAYDTGHSPCTEAQFLGEYLHAFQDTFAHRDQNNRPIPALSRGGRGFGHYELGHEPDYTFNSGEWTVREERTLKMEQETYELLRKRGNPENSIPWSELKPILEMVNRIAPVNESEIQHIYAQERKKQELDDFLKEQSLVGSEIERFSTVTARTNRDEYLCNLPNSVGTDAVILPSC